jgi:spore coat protein A
VLVNGKLLPYLEVEPRPYRFRLLNGSNGRFYSLTLTEGAELVQIGTDAGLLPAPVHVKALTIAPAERADLIVDFSRHAGKRITLRNQVVPIMQFRVSNKAGGAVVPLPKQLRSVPKLSEASAVRTRQLTLEEVDTVLDDPMVHLLNGSRWSDPITERPVIDTTEIWSFLNLTADTHPIHLHLVRFQILDGRSFDVPLYLVSKKLRYTGEPYPPEPNEAGWKDTVRVNPGTVTRIIVNFEGYVGRYVWHCHILEHEENEMMRPYEIVASDQHSD